MKTIHKIIFSILSILLVSTSLKAQNYLIDSLENELQLHVKGDTTRIKILNSLIYELYIEDKEKTKKLITESELLIDKLKFKSGEAELTYYKARIELDNAKYDESIKLNQQAYDLYVSLGDRKGESYSLFNKGVAYYYLGDFETAIEYYNKSAKIDEERNDLLGQAATIDNIGNIYADQSKYDKAIENYLIAKEIKESKHDTLGLASSYNNIGSVYGERNDSHRALEYFNKAFDIYEELDNEYETIQLLINMAIIYQNETNYDRALTYFNKGLDVCQKFDDVIGEAKCLNGKGFILKAQRKHEDALLIFNETLEIYQENGYRYGEAKSLNHLGDIYTSLKNKSKALYYYNQALVINEELDLIAGKSWSYFGLAQLHHNNKEYKKALDYGLKAEGISVEMGFIDAQRDISELLSMIYEKLGKYDDALKSHQKYKKLSDSLFNKENIEKIAQVEYEYKYKAELESASNRESKLTKDVETITINLEQSQRNLLIGVIVFLALVLVLSAIIFYLRLRNIKSKNENIATEQKLLRSQMTPHFIFNSLSVLQGMILNKEDDKAITYLSRFSKLLRIILENSRDKTVALGQELKAVENYLTLQNIEAADQFNFNIEVDRSIDQNKFKIPPMLIQPFIENAIEHGFENKKDDRKIDVKLNYRNSDLICEISDNGIGVGAQKLNKNQDKKSLATTITSERLTLLAKDFKTNGSIKIEDRKMYDAKGTIVTLVIPYKTDIT